MRTRPNITISAAVLLVVSLLWSVSAAAQSADRTITESSVGPATIGSTVEELTEQLGSDYTVGDEVRITVDFNGHVVSRGGSVQFRAVKASAPGDELSLFIVNNSDFTTEAGVGPDMLISDAEAIYGDATLTWSPDDEGREFVRFENQPEGRISFRTPGIAGTNVGVYSDDEFETDEYDDTGTIAAIWISCVPGTDCPDIAAVSGGAAEPTPTPTAEPTATSTPTPDATPTPEPTSTATPEPDTAESDDDEPDDEAANSGSASGGGNTNGGDASDQLPATGFEELALVALASVLLVIGGAFVLVNRNFLAPAWLHSQRW